MSVNKYNSEGYYDPTAYEALTIIDREISQRRYTRPRRYMPKVYICSPFRGEISNNVIKTRMYCSFAVKQGRIPFASHLLFPQFMSDSDPNERNLALFMALVYLDCCKECWVFGDTILKPGGFALSFGWNTNGVGKKRGFEIVEVLVVAHGGSKNDTLCTVERKLLL